MAVPSTWSDISTTAASNPPDGATEAANTVDNHLKQVYAFIRSLYEGSTNGQIAFPATQNASSGANVLDDYEEGTWTPTVVSASGSITAYTTGTCKYTKIGNSVHATADITITTKGTAAGNLAFSLPFQSSGNHGFGGGERVAIGFAVHGWVDNGSATANVIKYDGTTPFVADGVAFTVTVNYKV